VSLNDIIQAVVCVLGGGFAVQLFSYLRGTKKDAGELTMQMWLQLAKEQSDWRDRLTQDLKAVTAELNKVREENAELRGEVAALKIENQDLRKDNAQYEVRSAEMEKRVKELERELEKHTMVLPGMMPA